MTDVPPPLRWLVTQRTLLGGTALGKWSRGAVVLSPLGAELHACWRALASLEPSVAPDAFVVMPNHWHGVVLRMTEEATVGAAVAAVKTELRRRVGEHERRWNRWRRDRALRTVERLWQARQFVRVQVEHWPDHPYGHVPGEGWREDFRRLRRFKNVPWHAWW